MLTEGWPAAGLLAGKEITKDNSSGLFRPGCGCKLNLLDCGGIEAETAEAVLPRGGRAQASVTSFGLFQMTMASALSGLQRRRR